MVFWLMHAQQYNAKELGELEYRLEYILQITLLAL